MFFDTISQHRWLHSSGSRKLGLGGRIHGERGARAYNGGLGAVPPVGSWGKAPGRGFRGASPHEADKILANKTVSLFNYFIKLGQFIKMWTYNYRLISLL